MNMDAQFPIVGVGASAGGLRALESLFKAMPAEPGMAFVVITHLAPDRESLLTEILSRHAAMPVVSAQDGQQVEANRIYVLPPNAILSISDRRLQLRKMEAPHHERAPIDIFFSSLASDCGEYAAGVVLSGSGHDGVLGIKAIKEKGGVTLAQTSDSNGPGFAGMPESAIASGLIDFAVPADAMPAKLMENALSLNKLEGAEPTADDSVEAQQAIYTILRSQAGHDFSGYKTRTFMRRIFRRVQARHCLDLAGYVELLRREPDEAMVLFRDLLINVTSFFRDAEAFDSLRKEVIPKLFKGRGASDAIRVWTPGCATGEEVYSIAILLREHMEGLRAPPRVTIFATDIDEPALAVARAGLYPEALLEGLSEERRQRFFTPTSNGLMVGKSVRDLCVFSPHSVLRDPPFSRMDLISCRNLLIYFGAEAQRQVLPIFHYALRPGAYLFLGMSETIGRFSDLFNAIDKKNCVFQARDLGAPRRMPLLGGGFQHALFGQFQAETPGAASGAQLRQIVETRIADHFSPPHVVVNAEGEIVHFSPRTRKFIEAPAGAPTRQLMTSALKELRLDLRSALREAVETRRTVTREDIAFKDEQGVTERVTLIVEPVPRQSAEGPLFLVVFNERGPMEAKASAGRGGSPDELAESERELRDTRERLQGAIEQYESALEELKSTNEELVSLNEEMQSSNEELESSKEEMQSLNEELQTVNHELSAKIDDLDRANADLTNLFANTPVATIFLDRNLVIRSFTPAASALFTIIASDVGRPLGDFSSRLDYPELQADVGTVLKTGAPLERRAKTAKAEHFLGRLVAYRNARQEIDGVIATFVNVSSVAKSEQLAEQLTSMAAALPGAIYTYRVGADGAASYPYAAPKLLDVCGYRPEETAASATPIFEHIHAEDIDRVRASIEASAQGLTQWSATFRYNHPQKGMVWLEAHAMPVREADGAVAWHGYVRDVTSKMRAESALAESEERLRAVVNGAGDGIVTIDHSGVIKTVNAAALRMFGYADEEVIGNNVKMIVPEPHRSRHDSYLQNFRQTGEARIIGVGREIEGQRKDLSLFPMQLTVSELVYDHTRLFVGFVRDLTEQRRIEAQVQKLHAERLTAMGGMAAGLAHEINQPLSASASFLKAATRLLAMPPDQRPTRVEEALDSAAAQIVRAGRIMSRLREFVAGGEPDKTFRSLHDIIRGVYDEKKAEAQQTNIRMTLRLDAPKDRVLVDKVQIAQVLVNLIRNAEEAMAGAARRELTVATALAPGDMIRVDVIDSGGGMSDSTIKSLFEPFVTTKETGMGVGLTLSRTIIERHYGLIWAEKNPDGGTILSFTLPLASGEGA